MIATESALGSESQAPRAPEEVSALHEQEICQPWWRYGWGMACAAILFVAAVLRFYKLELKPLHNDEGVNAFFFLRLFRENLYRYDPANYHGPTLYYFALIASSVSTLFHGEHGLSIFVLRSVPALFGLATVFLIFKLRRYLGTLATWTAALLLAVSPGAAYFSRDFIHEPILVFLTLAVVVTALRFYERATSESAIIVAVVAAMLFATKETAPISFGVLVLALVATIFWPSRTQESKTGLRYLVGQLLERFGGAPRATRLLLACTATFLFLWILFYSSFFDNFRALHDALMSLKIWTSTGTSAHKHGVLTYFVWLGKEEWPLLVFGAGGTLIAVVRRKQFPLFVGLWAFGLIVAYSLIPYKTPWLTLNFLTPLALVSGYALSEAYNLLRSRSQVLSRLWISVILAASAVSIYNAWQLNLYRYDDDRNPYVYAQTRRELLLLVEKVNGIARQNGMGLQTSIAIMSPDYWPLPWYLREYSRAGYYGRVTRDRTDIIITSASQSGLLDFLLGADYKRVGEYPLRPGVNLVAFARTAASAPK